jgi:hypothetical protein
MTSFVYPKHEQKKLEFVPQHFWTHSLFWVKINFGPTVRWGGLCRNPSLGLATKAKAYKGAGQERSSGITSQTPRSVGKCEGMNLHTPKRVPTLGVGVSVDSQIFREQLQGSKPIGLRLSLYH